MDRGAWWATVHRVAKSRTRLNNNVTLQGSEKRNSYPSGLKNALKTMEIQRPITANARAVSAAQAMTLLTS